MKPMLRHSLRMFDALGPVRIRNTLSRASARRNKLELKRRIANG